MNDRNDFERAWNVPRETMAAFDLYAAMLEDWQTRMNLVGPSTLPMLWGRHFADSAQLLPLAGSDKRWLDIGAGAGFPGLVIALLDPGAHVTMVESIAKKCRFLEAVVEALQLGDRVRVANRRIEDLPAEVFDVITARALAGLDQLFRWGLRFAGAETRWLLPKGAKVAEELANAGRSFDYRHRLVPSCTDAAARIVVASKVVWRLRR